MKINIVAVGKLKKEYQDIVNQFKKRIEFFSSLNIIEVKEVKEENIDLQVKKETERVLEVIPKNSRVILASLNGTLKTSEEFAEYFNEDNITFVIGGSHGLIEKEFKEKIAFSRMTFNHQMFRTFLVEQIYRAFMIKSNGKYHK